MEKNFQKSYLAEFDRIDQTANGLSASPFHAVRKKAISLFEQQGFPSQQQEEWKYTNTRTFRSTPFKQQSSAPEIALSKQQLREKYVPIENALLLTFVDGYFSGDHSDSVSADIVVSSLQQALHSSDQKLLPLIDEHFSSLADPGEHGFIALNTALVQDGIVLSVPAETELETPIFALFLSSGAEDNLASYPRVLIHLEQGAQAQFVEAYHSLGDASYVTNSVSEVILQEKARLEHCRVVFEAPRGMHVSRLALQQADSSHFQSSVFNFGGNTIRNEVHARLDGEHIESRLNGLSIGSNSDRIDNSTVLDHAKPNCESFELYKGIYADKAQGAFSGTIIVRQDAQKTNAMQSSKSLLLSDTATSNSRPQLKIWADDVKCTHGATVGELDEEGLFYLRSRGIKESDAKNMLIHAFASDVIKELESDELKDYLEQQLMLTLEGLAQIQEK